MKRFTKIALGALMLTGATTTIAAPASARVFVGIGGPVVYGPAPVCNPYSPYYRPYNCGYGPRYVGGPVIGWGWGGGWHEGWHGGWHEGWRGGFHGWRR
jgi:hypothetical protein